MDRPDGLPVFETYRQRLQLDPEDVGTPAGAETMLAILQRMDITTLSAEQLDRFDALASSLMGAINAELLRRDGWVLHPGWIAAGRLPPPELVPQDHCYTLVNEEQERWLYISEPYPQTAESLAALAALAAVGWHVEVRSGLALHYPGHTLRIQIERAGAITEPAHQITRGLPRPT